MRRNNRIFITLVLLLLLALFGLGYRGQSLKPFADGARLWFFDIGQGDSILIDTPDRYQILIDGGPSDKILFELSKALGMDKEIDLVIVTHNDSDHLKGVLSVLNSYRINKVWFNGVDHDSDTYRQFRQIIANKQIPIEAVRAGQTIRRPDFDAILIHPFESNNMDEQNEAGIVIWGEYQKSSFLLTDDIGESQERLILNKGLVKPADILKVAHHGSSGSSSNSFLMAVKPKIAVISVGKNSYGHPAEATLARLKALSIPVLRTDQDQTIRFTLSAGRFSYQTGF